MSATHSMAFVLHKIAPGINVGDVLGHYTVQASLGRGNFSSVWLAEHKDQQQDHPASQLVALKVLHATTSSTKSEPDFEMRLARKEIEALKTSNGSFLLPDEIIHDGLAGHLGLVFTQLCGPSVFKYAISCPGHRLPLTTAKRVITETIAALQFLHARGIGHGSEQVCHSAIHDTYLQFETSKRATYCLFQNRTKAFGMRTPCYNMRKLVCES
jgi:serine/threonine protein kinase